MSYKVLEQNGVTNENVDGAEFNYFAAGKRDGILGGILNECAVYSPASNIVSISTGVISVQGFRVKITSDISWAVSGNADEYSIVFEIVLNPDRSVSSQFIAKPSSLTLVKDDLLVSEKGTHQIEIIRFNWDGNAVSNISRILPVIIAGSGIGGESIELAQSLSGNEEDKAPSVKAVNEGLARKVDKPNYSLAANQWVFGQDANGNPNALAAEVGNGQWHLARYLKPDDTKADSDRKGTLAVTMPQKPLHAANKQYVDDKVDLIKEDVELLKDLSAGVLYDIVTVESMVNPVTVPSNALPAATIDKIGAGIKTSVINEAKPSSNNATSDGVTVTYDGATDLYTLSSDYEVYGTPTLPIKTPINVTEGEKIYVFFEFVSGSVESSKHDKLILGTWGYTVTVPFGSKHVLEEHVGYYDDTISELAFNISVDSFKFNDFTFRLHIGKYKQTYGVPVASVKKGGETVYTVPEQIRTLKAHALEGHTPVDVYGLALSDTVYNYLDLVNKQYIIKCAMGLDEHNGLAVVPYEKTIDVSAYLTDEDGEITVSAGDRISFCDNDGILVPYDVPNAITYYIKKGV